LAFLACSKHESTPPLQNATLSLQGNTAVQLPSALTSSSDAHAQMAVGYVAFANGIGAYSALMKIPSGATKQSALLTASNGRISANTVTYTWSEPNYGTLGCQITDNGDSYAFELFVKYNNTSPWLRYLIGQEKKDLSSGSLKVLDISTSPSPEFYDYTWTRSSSDFNFTFTFPGIEKIVIKVNTQTKAGSVDYYNDTNTLEYHMSWGADGHGSWTYYDTDGTTVLQTGTW
jgi:hypothetical protein